MKKKLIKMMIVLTALAALSCENGLYDMADDLDGTVPICVDGDTGSDTNDGRGWGNAVATIGQAITLVSSGGDIWVKDITSGYTVNSSITVDKPVGIYGGFGGTEGKLSERPAGADSEIKSGGVDILDVNSEGVIIANIIFSQASAGGRAIDCQSGSSVKIESCDFTGLTVTGVNGGAINTINSEVIINNSHFSNNQSNYNGGAIYSSGGSVILNNSTFNGNIAGDNGGAIFSSTSFISITGSVFEQNQSDSGGVIYSSESEVFLYDGEFINNSGHDGGAVYFVKNSISEIYDSYFLSNSSTSTGGSIYSYGYYGSNNVSIWRCSFNGNSGSDRGGAILSSQSYLVIYDSIFKGNDVSTSALQAGGGAICIMGAPTPAGHVKIINTLFYQNSATGSNVEGGAVLAGITAGAGIKFLNCTFYGNETSSTSGGGGVVVGSSCAANVYNCIFYENRHNGGAAVSSILNSGTTNAYNNYWDAAPPSLTAGNNNNESSVDPFASVTPGDSDFLYLASGSTCINAGTNDLTAIGMTLPSTDLAGNPRIVGGTVDIGAYEKQ